MTLPFTRTVRTWWSKSLIASLLFLQLASAAYACAMPAAGAGGSSMADMPCAEAMARGDMSMLDPEQPGLCLEHCKGGSPTIEPGTVAGIALPALVALFVVAPIEATDRAGARQAQWRRRASAPPPPHAILHCCFRI